MTDKELRAAGTTGETPACLAPGMPASRPWSQQPLTHWPLDVFTIDGCFMLIDLINSVLSFEFPLQRADRARSMIVFHWCD